MGEVREVQAASELLLLRRADSSGCSRAMVPPRGCEWLGGVSHLQARRLSLLPHWDGRGLV